jgi:hypothetical protein
MEEPDQLPRVWIRAREVRAFMPIAMKTGQREVLKNSQPSMLARHNVIDMKGQRIDRRRQVTILAPILCALPDLPDNVPCHQWGRSSGFRLRASRALDCITASRFPTCK